MNTLPQLLVSAAMSQELLQWTLLLLPHMEPCLAMSPLCHLLCMAPKASCNCTPVQVAFLPRPPELLSPDLCPPQTLTVTFCPLIPPCHPPRSSPVLNWLNSSPGSPLWLPGWTSPCLCLPSAHLKFFNCSSPPPSPYSSPGAPAHFTEGKYLVHLLLGDKWQGSGSTET
jgi:hypothetical protein